MITMQKVLSVFFVFFLFITHCEREIMKWRLIERTQLQGISVYEYSVSYCNFIIYIYLMSFQVVSRSCCLQSDEDIRCILSALVCILCTYIFGTMTSSDKSLKGRKYPVFF